MVKYIGLFGQKEVGKNTFYDAFEQYVVGRLRSACSRVVTVKEASFAYHLRRILADTYGIPDEIMWSGDKDQLIKVDRLRWENLGSIVRNKYPDRVGYMTLRELLQVFGTDVIRDGWEKNFWAYFPFMQLKGTDVDFVIFTDCRFLNEVHACIDHDGIVINLLRPALESSDAHSSENQAIPEELFDFTIKGVEGVGPFTRQIHDFLDANQERFFGQCM